MTKELQKEKKEEKKVWLFECLTCGAEVSGYVPIKSVECGRCKKYMALTVLPESEYKKRKKAKKKGL